MRDIITPFSTFTEKKHNPNTIIVNYTFDAFTNSDCVFSLSQDHQLYWMILRRQILNHNDKGLIQNLYRSRLVRFIVSGDPTIVGTADLKYMPFSKIQGRLKPTLPTSVSHPDCKVKYLPVLLGTCLLSRRILEMKDMSYCVLILRTFQVTSSF